MKKVFIMAGEPSGDETGAWYITQEKKRGQEKEYIAIGGAKLEAAGAKIHRSIDGLAISGAWEVVKHIPKMIGLMYSIVRHIRDEKYNEVVLIDYPGFNLWLMRLISYWCPKVAIIYVAPPQMWVWGARRAKLLKKMAKKIIVLYPFEQEWFQQRGIAVEWWGTPLLEKVSYTKNVTREKNITLMLGSRKQEVISLAKYFVPALARLLQRHPGYSVSVLVADHISTDEVIAHLHAHGAQEWKLGYAIITDEAEKKEIMQKAVCALTKPGTNTLELALMGTPAVVAYKTSWMTYWLARSVIKLNSITLPNIFLKDNVYPELIQFNCTPSDIAYELNRIIDMYEKHPERYEALVSKILQVRDLLIKKH